MDKGKGEKKEQRTDNSILGVVLNFFGGQPSQTKTRRAEPSQSVSNTFEAVRARIETASNFCRRDPLSSGSVLDLYPKLNFPISPNDGQQYYGYAIYTSQTNDDHITYAVATFRAPSIYIVDTGNKVEAEAQAKPTWLETHALDIMLDRNGQVSFKTPMEADVIIDKAILEALTLETFLNKNLVPVAPIR